MQGEKVKVYTYTRVLKAMQTDGYSLDAQKARMKAFADYNDYEIVGERRCFFRFCFKLFRFGKNVANVLSTLQVMQDRKSDLRGGWN